VTIATPVPGDFVKVVYKGRDIPTRTKLGEILDTEFDSHSPYTLMWDAKPYKCEVGKTTFVPFEAVANALGDPRSTDNMRSVRDVSGNTFFILDRATEVRRLRALYDNQIGSEEEILYAPQMTVTDLEDNPILTVLDDPTGDSVMPAPPTKLDRDQLLAQLERQQRMIETLAKETNIDLNNPEASDDPEPPKPKDPFATPPEDTGK
jgi:hypothetical protein